MNDVRDNRIPLTILGGFLGSGKTTWLRHQLHSGRLANALIIVNEAADVPVDDMLLSQSTDMRVLAGGCACCEGRAGLLALLRQICDERVGRDAAAPQISDIILETSGLADPGPIGDAILSDPVLTHHIVVREIVVVVDALHGLKYVQSERLGRRQIETADRLVITKADAADERTIKLLRATLEQTNPGAAITAAAMGSPMALPSSKGVLPAILPQLDNTDPRPVISTTVKLDHETDWVAFGLWLSALLHARGEDLVRVKGVVKTPSGRLLLQTVRKVVQSPEIIPPQLNREKDENSIVFIGRGFNSRDLEMSLLRFAGLKTESGTRSAKLRPQFVAEEI